MSAQSLIVLLPTASAPPAVGWAYATAIDGRPTPAQGRTAPDLLPGTDRGTEGIAVVPAARLSWQTIDLPKGVGPGSPRLRSVLQGLIEERVLDEFEAVHLALAPGARAGQRALLAVCDKAWLRAQLAVLESAGRRIHRIVPELAPVAEGTLVVGVESERGPRLLFAGPATGGLPLDLPLTAETVAWVHAASPDEPARLHAEPAVAELAGQWFQREAALLPRAERLVAAAGTAWDLAQFEFDRSGQARAMERVQMALGHFLRDAAWRPARWAATALVVIQVLGLNAWAWHEQRALRERQQAIDKVLTETFPQTRVVIDAPLQMDKEVQTLRRNAGTLSPRDFEAMLGTLGAALPPGRAPSQIGFTPGELRVQGLGLAAGETEQLVQKVQSAGYAVQPVGDAVQLRREGGS